MKINYGDKISISVLSPLPCRIKVKYGKHWYPALGWKKKKWNGWLVLGKNGMATLMRPSRVKKMRDE